MNILAKIFIGSIAVFHLYIAWFEMFAWTTRGPVVFSTFPAELFEPTIALAANQGIYNAFLAVGLIWSLLIRDRIWWRRIAICFLLFVAVAGIVGGLTVTMKIMLLQTLPAVFAIVLVVIGNQSQTDGVD